MLIFVYRCSFNIEESSIASVLSLDQSDVLQAKYGASNFLNNKMDQNTQVGEV